MLLIRFKREPLIVLSVFFGTFLILSSYSTAFNISLISEALAQSDIQTVKYRDLVIDLGDGVTTNAQLSYPAIGKGPFPAVLLVQGSGALDMNETLTKNSKPFWEISQYLSERGFAVPVTIREVLGKVILFWIQMYGEIIQSMIKFKTARKR